MNEALLHAPRPAGDTESAERSAAEAARDGALAQEWLVELMARTWLEPALADRYRADARSVLDEFGFTLPVGEQAPALPADPVSELSIEELSRPAAAHATGTYCIQMDAMTVTASDGFAFTPAVVLDDRDLPEDLDSELSIEELSRPVAAHTSACFCIQMDSVSASAASRTILR
ncbi:TIGR04351 family putative TOMM peptide [Streptomyces sp. NPDC000594]|uniref:TIGR04351 family putative TOMM peptide n=1 Tax=Streptomyces sp. NPDC000594 TaxID=3154261 RepID=UPI00331E9CFF